MDSYRAYRRVVVGFLVVFVGFLGAVTFWSGPEAVEAEVAPAGQAVGQAVKPGGAAAPAVVNFPVVRGNVDSKPLLSSENQLFLEGLIEQFSTGSQAGSGYAATVGPIGSASVEPTPVMSSGPVTQSGSSAGSSASSSGSTSGSTSSSTDSPPAENTAPRKSTGGGGGGGAVPSRTILEELRELKPLPKVHYAWGLPSSFLNTREHDLRQEYARITHSLTINGAALAIHGQSQAINRIDNLVYACAKINMNNPDIPVSIALGYSPWHRKFMPGVSLTNNYSHAVFSHPTYQEEINEFVTQMTFTKQQIAAGNQKYGSDVQVTALLMNTERFSPRRNDTNWNQAMAKALDDIHKKAIELFPDARIEWYSRGMGGYTIASLSPWYSYFTRQEEHIPTLSYAHFVVPEIDYMREVFRKTCELADTLNVQEVTPWLGLAWGRKRTPGSVVFEAWDYDVKYSYQVGKELNDFCQGSRPTKYPPYQRVGVVVIYTPFATDIPDFGKHFIEYCKGAAAANK